MNRIVFCPEVRRRFVAAAMTRRISATLLSTPLIRMNLAWVISAMTRASVVFPVPGDPDKITDGKRSASIARRSNFPGPRICSWPTNSRSDRGRIRVASGAASFTAATPTFVASKGSTSFSSNRSCTEEKYDGSGDYAPWSGDWGQSPQPKNRNFTRQTPYYVTDEFSRRDEYPAATICRAGVDGGVGNCCCRFLSNCSVSLVVRCDCIRAAGNSALFLAELNIDISSGAGSFCCTIFGSAIQPAYNWLLISAIG